VRLLHYCCAFPCPLSLLIAAGVNAKAITAYLGHASIQTTFDLYGHLRSGVRTPGASSACHTRAICKGAWRSPQALPLGVGSPFVDRGERAYLGHHRASAGPDYRQAVPHAPPMPGISEPGQHCQQARRVTCNIVGQFSKVANGWVGKRGLRRGHGTSRVIGRPQQPPDHHKGRVRALNCPSPACHSNSITPERLCRPPARLGPDNSRTKC
jgi:hypothetical protein